VQLRLQFAHKGNGISSDKHGSASRASALQIKPTQYMFVHPSEDRCAAKTKTKNWSPHLLLEAKNQSITCYDVLGTNTQGELLNQKTAGWLAGWRFSPAGPRTTAPVCWTTGRLALCWGRSLCGILA
jgi:hypothetical protein